VRDRCARSLDKLTAEYVATLLTSAPGAMALAKNLTQFVGTSGSPQRALHSSARRPNRRASRRAARTASHSYADSKTEAMNAFITCFTSDEMRFGLKVRGHASYRTPTCVRRETAGLPEQGDPRLE
jgi:hypothetical protein